MAYLQQVNKAATRLCAIWLTCNKDVCHMAHLQQGATKCFAFASGFVDSPPFFNL